MPAPVPALMPSTFLFVVGLTFLLLRARTRARAEGLQVVDLWFADDGSVIGAPAAVERFTEIIKEELALACLQVTGPEWNPAWHLGVPMRGGLKKAKMEQYMADMVALRSHPNAQTAFAILQSSAGSCARLSYLCGVVPPGDPALDANIRELDAAMMHTVEILCGSLGFTLAQRLLVELPLEHGGLGLRRMETCHAAVRS